jgi:hypothetical protein
MSSKEPEAIKIGNDPLAEIGNLPASDSPFNRVPVEVSPLSSTDRKGVVRIRYKLIPKKVGSPILDQ